MANTDDSLKQKTLELLQLALAGSLKFDDLYREWPLPEMEMEGLYPSILEDLSAAVEHTPGSLFTGKVDRKAWVGSLEYNQIYLDFRLLQTRLPLSRVEEILSEARERDLGSPEEIDRFLAALTAQD